MTASEITKLFPSIGPNFNITSPPDEIYNCIAWALNDKDRWWWPPPAQLGFQPGQYWPPQVPREETLSAFTQLYSLHGFVECQSPDPEDGFDKIAIYVGNDGKVTHAARWWAGDQGWSSKLGGENDICHHRLDAVEGNLYGKAVKIMRRLREAT